MLYAHLLRDSLVETCTFLLQWELSSAGNICTYTWTQIFWMYFYMNWMVVCRYTYE